MATVVVSPTNVASFPDGGGHFWVYMQYVQGLRQLGHNVYWLEQFRGSGDVERDSSAVETFRERMARFGLEKHFILYVRSEAEGKREYLDGVQAADAEALFRRANLLLNFHYAIDPALLALFRQTALVDIDPGLLQFWLSHGQIAVAPHDLYFTIGETVGTPSALFSDCGLPWIQFKPPLCLDLWPFVHDPQAEAFTTISSWWADEWIKNGAEVYENNKRVTFIEFADLPCLTKQPLELALYLGGEGDAADQRLLRERGWRVRHSLEAARTPDMYRSYIRSSRGEFSCAKPSCMKFQNAWISDRTLCYLASGKPAVVQDTGPSSYLPNGEGLFRFSTIEQAVSSIDEINRNYFKHCQMARRIVERYFDSKVVLSYILERSDVDSSRPSAS